MRRRVLVLCALVVVASFAVGTGSYSAASVERNTTVDVVADEDAYMSLLYSDDTVRLEGSGAHEVTVVTVRNRFTQPVNFAVTVTVTASDGLTVEADAMETTSVSAGIGDAFDVPATIACQSPGQHRATIAFDVTATGAGVSAETATSRTIEYFVNCSNGQKQTDTGV
ncbi:hypothetical protein GOC83_10100 [Haloarcula rubripromontorii]|uniref:DUF11 domain-containing protein n=1 Tax=Haloarcula rubripromontorii TaxID=1705562 RepID=A0A847U5N0_9EURY|nr:hypothetical protein [Haloarcula rubripromontorii]NLV06478.1 hypothetical protein [Haloarcula rubripromontorii]